MCQLKSGPELENLKAIVIFPKLGKDTTCTDSSQVTSFCVLLSHGTPTNQTLSQCKHGGRALPFAAAACVL